MEESFDQVFIALLKSRVSWRIVSSSLQVADSRDTRRALGPVLWDIRAVKLSNPQQVI